MRYRQGDVRDPAALERAFAGVDVVVHLAFMITGTADRQTIRAINVEGTMNTFHAAAAAGAQCFVYASSVAAYGFHRDNPVGMTEDWPTRGANHLFYAQQKAEIEGLLRVGAAAHASIGLYMLRPPTVLGPHGIGAKKFVPTRLEPLGQLLATLALRLPVARRRSCRRCRCSSSTSRTLARRCAYASWHRVHQARTTSRATAS
jgi:nucleoside-diphosphate-sugar epimerase